MRVGFIGTGKMGNPMARHLLRAGHQLTVTDKRPEASANLLDLGAAWAESPAAVTQASEVVFTSLPGPADVDIAVLADDGILAGATPGTIHVDLTTSLPSATKRLAWLEGNQGVSFVEAPVSGLVPGAEAGTLAIFCGGDAAAVEQVRPLLETFGSNVFHVGEVGLGSIMKLTNNMIVHASALVVQEALAVGLKAGISLQRLYEMWNVSSSSRFVQEVPSFLERNFENPNFTAALTAKDAGLFVEAARELGVSTGLGVASAQLYMRANTAGFGHLSRQGGSINTIEREAGVRFE